MIVVDFTTSSASVSGVRIESGATRLLVAQGLAGSEEVIVSTVYDGQAPVPAKNPDGTAVKLTATVPMALLAGEADYHIAKPATASPCRITLGYKR